MFVIDGRLEEDEWTGRISSVELQWYDALLDLLVQGPGRREGHRVHSVVLLRGPCSTAGCGYSDVGASFSYPSHLVCNALKILASQGQVGDMALGRGRDV